MGGHGRPCVGPPPPTPGHGVSMATTPALRLPHSHTPSPTTFTSIGRETEQRSLEEVAAEAAPVDGLDVNQI